MAFSGQIIHNPDQRRAHRVPAHGAGHRRRAARVRAAAHAGRQGARRARAPRAGGALPRARGDDAFRLGCKKIVAGPGETVIVPAGARHKFANGGDMHGAGARQVEPALDMEQLLETTAELAHEGNTLRSGMPKPLHLALFVQRFKREVRAPFPPAWMVARADGPAARDRPRTRPPRALYPGACAGVVHCCSPRRWRRSPRRRRRAETETLFDGRSLKGWRHAGGARRSRSRADAAHRARHRQLGLLYYARKRYRDFELTPAVPRAPRAPTAASTCASRSPAELLLDRLRLRGPDQRHRRRPAQDGLDLRLRRPRRHARRTGQAAEHVDEADDPRRGPDVHRLPRRQAHQPLRRHHAAAPATSACRRTAALRTSSRSGPSGSASSEPPPTGSGRRSTAPRRPAPPAPTPAPRAGSRRS